MNIYQIAIPALLLVLLICFVLLKKKSTQKVQVTKISNGKWYLRMHRLYQSIPLISKYYKMVYANISSYYPTDNFSIIKRTVSTVSKGFAIFTGCIIFVIIMAGSDLLFLLTGFVVSFILMLNSINSKMEKQETNLLLQFQGFLEDLRYYYNDTKKVDEAIDGAMTNAPKEISLHMQQVYDAVTAVDIDEEVEKYTEKSVNNFFLLFCSICATIMKHGDKPLPEGVTIFLNNIKHLQEELNVEILKRRDKKRAFAGVSMFCLLPVLLMKPVQLAFSSSQKDVSKYYEGSYGIVVMFVVFFATIIGNVMIENLRNGTIIENHKLWNKLAELPILKKIINKEISTHYSSAQRLRDSLKRVGSQITVKGFYAQKAACMVGTMLLMTVVILSANIRERSELLHNFTDTFQTDYAVNEEYTNTLEEFAKNETKYHLKDKDFDSDEFNKALVEEVLSEGTITKISTAQEIANVVTDRLANYHNVYYRWWFVLLTYFAGMLGYRIPEIILKNRKKAMEMEMENEIIQFQSIALIMMHLRESTVEGILTWMNKFSKCFRVSISTCLMNLDSGEQQALEDLKEAEPAPQFQKIVNSLMNVDKVGVEAAFDSLETERKFLTEKRKKDNEEAIFKKSRKAWRIVILLLFLVIVSWIIAPMLMMALSMISQFSSVITF